MVVARLSISLSLSIITVPITSIMAISMMSVAMMVVARLSISLSLSIITVSITSIVAVSMVIVSWLSSGSCFGFPLSIVAMTISTISMMSIAMMVVARLSISLSLSIITVSITSISTISTMTISMVISWFSSSCAKDGKSNSNQKIHVVFGLNFSETPPCFPC